MKLKDLHVTLNTNFEISEIDNLLKEVDIDNTRVELLKEFDNLKLYSNLREWNKLVSVCELLAHIGWNSENEYEAHKSKYFNGNPYTFLLNQFGEISFLNALWSKRKDGFVIEVDRVTIWIDPKTREILPHENFNLELQSGEFNSQRNWIRKSPIKIGYLTSNFSVELYYIKHKITEIDKILNHKLSSKSYGEKFQYINVNCSFQNRLNRISDTNFELKRFTKKTGVLEVQLNISNSFSDLSQKKQVCKLLDIIIVIFRESKEKLFKRLNNYSWDEFEKDLLLATNKIKTDL